MSLFKHHLWTFIFCLHLCLATATSFTSTTHFVSTLSSSSLDFMDYHCQAAVRWGEARHPGPSTDWHLFGFSNPSGLRQKEEVAMSLGPGVWSFSETQLSQITQRSCAARLRQEAASRNRQLRIHMGAPVATRATSSWAGSWTGVATISDWPSQEIMLPNVTVGDC